MKGTGVRMCRKYSYGWTDGWAWHESLVLFMHSCIYANRKTHYGLVLTLRLSFSSYVRPLHSSNRFEPNSKEWFLRTQEFSRLSSFPKLDLFSWLQIPIIRQFQCSWVCFLPLPSIFYRRNLFLLGKIRKGEGCVIISKTSNGESALLVVKFLKGWETLFYA